MRKKAVQSPVLAFFRFTECTSESFRGHLAFYKIPPTTLSCIKTIGCKILTHCKSSVNPPPTPLEMRSQTPPFLLKKHQNCRKMINYFFMCTKRLVQFIPYNITVSSTVTAGILTNGFPPCYIRSMRTGSRHWRARGHREITSSFLQVS